MNDERNKVKRRRADQKEQHKDVHARRDEEDTLAAEKEGEEHPRESLSRRGRRRGRPPGLLRHSHERREVAGLCAATAEPGRGERRWWW